MVELREFALRILAQGGYEERRWASKVLREIGTGVILARDIENKPMVFSSAEGFSTVSAIVPQKFT